jgi:membrane-associated protease RseP (regulator of RpoE activity)
MGPEHVSEADGEHARSDAEVDEGPRRAPYGLHAFLFLVTVTSVLHTGAEYALGAGKVDSVGALLVHGWRYALPLMLILLCHEFGHYVAARLHGVDASLPFFIPAPVISAFGTMGAVIRMREDIRSRNALLDIGAAGPLAGLAIALPVLVVGLATSPVERHLGWGRQEGQSLLYLLLKRAVIGPIPAGYDVSLNSTAYAGWVGLFVTALNLLPIGQLDGGHIAYALFGKAQDRVSRWVHAGLLGMFAINVYWFAVPVLLAGARGDALWYGLGNTAFWLFWFGLLHLMRRLGGDDHPPTEPGELSPGRRVVAIISLIIFVLLFMPTPMSTRWVD